MIVSIFSLLEPPVTLFSWTFLCCLSASCFAFWKGPFVFWKWLVILPWPFFFLRLPLFLEFDPGALCAFLSLGVSPWTFLKPENPPLFFLLGALGLYDPKNIFLAYFLLSPDHSFCAASHTCVQLPFASALLGHRNRWSIGSARGLPPGSEASRILDVRSRSRQIHRGWRRGELNRFL